MRKPILGLITIILFLSACRSFHSPYHEFALLGDNPYSPVTYEPYVRMIEHVNQQSGLQWVIHLGDVKGGASSCSDAELTRYFELNQRFDLPFIVTPGDNDWLDCKRSAAGEFNDYERLDAFRKIFYPSPGFSTGKRPMAITQQSQGSNFSEFVENAMWDYQGVVYASVHVVALTAPATEQAVFERRIAAASAWIKAAFDRAHDIEAKGVFLAMQADPWIVWGLPPLLRRDCASCAEPRATLEWLYPLLVEASLAFDKPVVLAVGDTHIYRVDKPLYTEFGRLVENFTRVESFGNPYTHWVRVRVEPDTAWVFSFQQQIVK